MPAPRKPLTSRKPVHLRSVTLEAVPSASGPMEPRWQQVALAGRYNGYARGERPFEFTRSTFEAAVANLRARPGYAADPVTGEGTVDLISWDFEHVSEGDNVDPAQGLPAVGWSRDLRVVDGAGGAELWALTYFVEPALGYVREGRYKDASISMQFDYVDPVSGAMVGPYITSSALTNRPFIQGMLPIAASMGYFSPSTSPGEALEQMRNLFGYGASAGVAEIMIELNKVAGWLASGSAPLGVEMEDIMSALRTLLGLPALTGMPDVLDNARQIVQRLLDETGPTAPALSDKGKHGMEIKLLATKLGSRETDEAVLSAVEDLIALRSGVVASFKLSDRDGLRVLLDATADSAAVRDKLSALLKALGVEDVAGAVDRVASLISQAEELKGVMPELAGLRAAVVETEAVAAEAEVTEAMASYKIPAEARDALVMLRQSDKVKFTEKFPRKVAAPVTEITKKSLLTLAAPNPKIAPAPAGAAVVNLSLYEGRNLTEKAMNYLSLTMAGWDKMTHEQRFKATIALKQSPQTVTSVA